ncbi:hypothetical protein [Streptomyces sp. NPDC015131]|uniref:hypothetical protein n=1 Tax=Streptomyces sp. NPDC015131 TaxID=3364941 RepID=UPI0036FB73F0
MEHEPEGRILAAIEQGLTSDDPGLAARMNTLNDQFTADGAARRPAPAPGTGDDPGERAAEEGRADRRTRRRERPGRPSSPPGAPRRNWRRRTVLILFVVALVGMLLTAVLNASSYEPPAPPGGPAPAASLP